MRVFTWFFCLIGGLIMFSHEAQYEIIKVLNNNVILAFDMNKNQELIIVGKGVGFGHRKNDILKLSNNEIEKLFITYDKKMKNQYYQLINFLDEDVMAVSEELIAMGEKSLGPLNPHIHIALTDHIGFSIERIKQGIDVNNPFLNEIKLLYPEEYRISVEASKIINKTLNVDIPESEIGFIALHFHSARQNKKVGETVKYTSLIKRLIEIVEKELNVQFDSTDLSYIRLVSHFRFVIDRLEKGKSEENPILNRIKTEYKSSFEIAKKVGKCIEDTLSLPISDDELGYITIHIQRIKLNKRL